MNKLKRVIWALVLSLLSANSAAKELTSVTINNSLLDDYLSALNQHHKMMTAVYVSQNGKPIYQHYAGYASIEEQVAITEHTRFRIGSISKIYTAVLVMQLVEQGKLALDETLDRYYPEINNADSITIHNLLNHRSGIANFTDQPDYPNYMTQAKTPEQMLAIINALPSEFKPDSQHAYSNTNYVLLGYILEKVYQKQMAQIIAEKIAEPLKLKATYFGNAINTQDSEASSYFYSQTWNKAPETNMQIPHGAGAIVATAQETSEFLQALFNGELVSGKSLQAMMELRDGYGLGMFAMPFYERQFYGHNGSIDGFLSATGYNPEDGLAITVLTNARNYASNDVLIAVLSGVYGMDFDLPDFSAQAVELPQTALSGVAGDFTSSDLPLDIRIFLENQQLMAQASGQGAFPLTPYSATEFRFDGAGIVIKFDAEEEDQAKWQRFVLHQGGGQFRYERK